MSADLFAEFSQPFNSSQQRGQNTKSFPYLPAAHSQNSASTPAPGLGSSLVEQRQPQLNSQWLNAQFQQISPSHPARASWNGTRQSGFGFDAGTGDGDGDGDDSWGDFEVAEPVKVSEQKSATIDSWDSLTSWAPPASTPSMLGSAVPTSSRSPLNHKHRDASFSAVDDMKKKTKQRLVVQTKASDPDVLFDINDFELDEADDEEDDFGDFETMEQTSFQPNKTSVTNSPPVSLPSMDLLSLDDTQTFPATKSPLAKTTTLPLNTRTFGASAQTKPQASTMSTPLSSTTTTSLPSSSGASKFNSANSASRYSERSRESVLAVGSNDSDEWDAWDDKLSSERGPKANIDRSGLGSWNWDVISGQRSDLGQDTEPPPLNVPPPAILLSVFPDLFSSANSFFKSLSGLDTATKRQILANSKAVQFLQGYIMLATTAAHVIAGRKLRWHRDKILAKSMSISAAGSKGMKLAGIDKTQSAREDREAVDVAASWLEHVGRLRSAVATANSSAGANLRVPELKESLQTKGAKMVPTSSKPCVVCGLKREERVVNVDNNVEDSFGEWWVEHWGHRACKNFWVQHEKKLRQR